MTSTAGARVADTSSDGPRLLLGSGPGLAEHLSLHGPLPALAAAAAAADIVARTEQAGLTGRGGAAFPTARKLAAVAHGPNRRGTVVVANGLRGRAGQRERPNPDTGRAAPRP